MPYSVKAVIIIAAVAVVSFIVAELVIPERGAPAAKESAAKERQQAQPGGGRDEDIPVVVVGPPPQPAVEMAASADTKASKAELADAKASKAGQADTKASKAVDAKMSAALPQKTTAPEQATAPQVQSAGAPKLQPAAAQPTPPPTPQRQTASPYRIEKAALCSAVKDREPQGVSDRFPKDAPQVYYYTSIAGARDTTSVIHLWYQNEALVQTSVLAVKSQYWRTHSRRNLLTHKGDVTGQWRVDVVEPGSKKVIQSASFTIE